MDAPVTGTGTGGGGKTSVGGVTAAVGGTTSEGGVVVGGVTGVAGSNGTAGSLGKGGSGPAGTTGTSCAGSGDCGGSASTPDAGSSGPDAPLVCTLGPTVSEDPSLRSPAPRPAADSSMCGNANWTVSDGVCAPQYCSADNTSSDCSSCGGAGSSQCTLANSKACGSGQWPEVHCVSDNESWHYSRSTHFGLTSDGACDFGLYGLCTTNYSATGQFADQCRSFCTAHPDLCSDPDATTLRGNFAAPDGDYYTQFWPSLPGDNDNYLSCGECFQLARTKKDGTDYQPGETGYTPPIVLQIIDSCPCSANPKWCCGSGRDHCGEVSDFAYGCPLPPSTKTSTVPLDHDPLPNESLHLDLSDIAMSRLQTGDATKPIVDGVIPTRYRRVPCPVKGNIHIRVHSGGSEYYFALSVVNVSGFGALVSVEAQLPSGTWLSLIRDPNYKTYRPQERGGRWALPQGAKVSLPVALRFTDASGRSLVSEQAITAWPPMGATDFFYFDTGGQF